MNTEYLHYEDLNRAGEMLAQGKRVAFPTETVYGLGANAFSVGAIQGIFEAKGRPSDNPLIVHLSSLSQIDEIASDINSLSRRLMELFWPGPLTLVVPKRKSIPDIVTAGLDTVAVRVPNHPWSLAILQAAKVPIAAPSANRSGSPSATTWQDVAADLDGLIEGIVCGPSTQIGLESTVVDASGTIPRILRPGKISYEELMRVCPEIVNYSIPSDALASSTNAQPIDPMCHSPTLANSPGLRHKHYQPSTPVFLIRSPREATQSDAFYLGLEFCDNNHLKENHLFSTVDDYASNLFRLFRKADDSRATCIYCQSVSESGLGVALMDRLRRASQRHESSKAETTRAENG